MPYRSAYAPKIADLLLQQGEDRARMAADSGRVWGGAVQNIGQQVAGVLGDVARNKAEAPQRALQAEREQLGLETARLGLDAARRRETDAQGDAERSAALRQRAEQVESVKNWLADIASSKDPAAVYAAGRDAHLKDGTFIPEDAPDFFPGMGWVKSKMARLLPEAERYKQLFPEVKAPIQRDPTKDLVNPDTFEVVNPGRPEPKASPNPTEASLAAAAAAGDTKAARALQLLRQQRPEPQGSRTPIWVMQDGKFVDLAGVAPPGSQPASSREQGRAVTSGDAGRIADLDTSLNDLDTLEKQLGTTGAASKVGAMLPNAVTEYTGWGLDAKSRQGTIDRVKQVIGKALEGGVLRKEDEYKYSKILPQIGDPPPVAKAKLAGLRAALKQRRQVTLDNLQDAGYEVSKFNQRAPADTPKPADPLGIR